MHPDDMMARITTCGVPIIDIMLSNADVVALRASSFLSPPGGRCPVSLNLVSVSLKLAQFEGLSH